ncbi:hypothetical protein [Candidatus Epulonipiscium viviparus]|uniref:hypothetical protein n=1 Tax=Candidatus Epulonipiscium viviparus TaxID=420336 RepID=UPI0027380F46|nr:hypothetical protein [Candidatus Epulopiscium viviparus]
MLKHETYLIKNQAYAQLLIKNQKLYTAIASANSTIETSSPLSISKKILHSNGASATTSLRLGEHFKYVIEIQNISNFEIAFALIDAFPTAAELPTTEALQKEPKPIAAFGIEATGSVAAGMDATIRTENWKIEELNADVTPDTINAIKMIIEGLIIPDRGTMNIIIPAKIKPIFAPAITPKFDLAEYQA